MTTLTVDIKFECGGCDRVEHVSFRAIPRRVFISITGRSYGIGSYETKWDNDPAKILDHAPEGWMIFDPYTQTTYCSDCWAGIEAPKTEELLREEG